MNIVKTLPIRAFNDEMKTIYSLLFVSVMLIASCQPAADHEVPVDAGTALTAAIDSHNSRNSIDWAGTYSGKMPCADCEGIATVLRLDSSGKFVLTTTYLGKSSKPFIEKGEFTWSEDGTTVRLKFEGNSSDRANLYRVGEGNLTQLDRDGKVITGALEELYLLIKDTLE